MVSKILSLSSSTTGLNLASQLFTFLLESSSLLTQIYNLLQIKINNKRHLHSQYFKRHLLCNQLKSRHLHNQCYLRINKVHQFNRIKINHL